MPALPNLPDDFVNITDDDNARNFLIECALLERLESAGALTKGLSAVCGFNHASHWILAVKYSGFPNPDDNGFQVRAWPKSQFPRSVIREQLELLGVSQPRWMKIYREDRKSVV